MGTGNDPALPTPTDQTTPTNPENNQPDPSGGLHFTHPQPDDPDEVALTEALAAAEAEEAAGGAKPTDGAQGTDPAQQPQQPAAGQPNQQPQPGPQQPQQPQPGVPLIPKPRFDEALAARDRAMQDAAYWRGRAEAGSQPASGQQPGQPQPQPQTAEQRLAEIHRQQDQLAAEFDDGKFTMADFKRKERELNDQEQQIREDALLARVKPTAPTQPSNDELYLDTLTAQLETQHPWVQVADKVGSDAEWGFVKDKAIENLTQRGIDPTKGNVGRYELRKEIAVLWGQLGPALIGERAKAKNIALPGAQQPASQGQPQQPAKPQLSAHAQARLNKLDLAAGAPPDLSNMNGNPGDPSGMSEERVETLSEEDFDKLPVATRNKLLGFTA